MGGPTRVTKRGETQAGGMVETVTGPQPPEFPIPVGKLIVLEAMKMKEYVSMLSARVRPSCGAAAQVHAGPAVEIVGQLDLSIGAKVLDVGSRTRSISSYDVRHRPRFRACRLIAIIRAQAAA